MQEELEQRTVSVSIQAAKLLNNSMPKSVICYQNYI